MKTYVPRAAVGRVGEYLIAAMSIVGCGVPEQESTEPVLEVAQQQQGLMADGVKEHKDAVSSKLPPVSGETAAWACPGWTGGGRYCLANCQDMGWQYVGAFPDIPFGQCENRARDFCRFFGKRHLNQCWGVWLP